MTSHKLIGVAYSFYCGISLISALLVLVFVTVDAAIVVPGIAWLITLQLVIAGAGVWIGRLVMKIGRRARTLFFVHNIFVLILIVGLGVQFDIQRFDLFVISAVVGFVLILANWKLRTQVDPSSPNDA